MNEAVTSSELLPLPLRLLVLALGIGLMVVHLALAIYAAAKAWWNLPGPQATLWTILCLFIPLPLVAPLILLGIVKKHGRQPSIS
jgi:hypothetical protein